MAPKKNQVFKNPHMVVKYDQLMNLTWYNIPIKTQMTNYNQKTIEFQILKKTKSQNQKRTLNANINYTDIQEATQDSNTRLINESRMVQDSELPKNNNRNTENDTNLDSKENENILPEDSDKPD